MARMTIGPGPAVTHGRPAAAIVPADRAAGAAVSVTATPVIGRVET